MKFLRNIFKSSKNSSWENYFIEQKEKHIDFYSNSWVTNEIPNIDNEISNLIYHTNVNESIINEFLNFGNNSSYSDSHWKAKGELNFPGPFYTGTTDSTGNGIIESPNNVILDENCMEYVMIQPRTRNELLQLWIAGTIEAFSGYYCDGNEHWTVNSVKDWWKNKKDIIEHLSNIQLIKLNCNQEKRFKYYLEHEARNDLRSYCFFLDNGFYPTNEKLPSID